MSGLCSLCSITDMDGDDNVDSLLPWTRVIMFD